MSVEELKEAASHLETQIKVAITEFREATGVDPLITFEMESYRLACGEKAVLTTSVHVDISL